MMMPPSAAPGRLPMPPSTAATNAFSPGKMPMSGSMAGELMAKKIPAAAASAEPRPKVKLMIAFGVDAHQRGGFD